MNSSENSQKLARALQALLLYTLLVIVWGAWVRISKSGDGCGATWPLCQGDYIPLAATQKKTWIEYAHRLMSGLYGFFVLWIWLRAKADLRLRKSAHAVLIFMILEALLGAKLVLFGLVGENASLYRAFVMALHQVNSLLLMGSIALLGLQNKHRQIQTRNLTRLKSAFVEKVARWKKMFLVLLSGLAVTGAFAALSGTLFPSESLWAGFLLDFQANLHPILRLRIAHPILGLGLGSLILFVSYRLSERIEDPQLRSSSLRLAGFVGVQMIFGLATLFLLSPTWMKLMHLALAHLLWISLVTWVFWLTYESSPESIKPDKI